MVYFTSDYTEGCHERILQRMIQTNLEQTPGYGTDYHCMNAARYIKAECGREDVDVHFLVGGTQTNLTLIDAALRPHQGAVCAESGHIHVHETGAVEATGHKCLTLPSSDGKITAEQVANLVHLHRIDESMEHTVQPGLVYISNPTEYGTIYSKAELERLSAVCRENGLFLFLDGARLGYGLRCRENDVTLADLANLCDAFYIGGTKVGALFGEAAVIANPALKEDFRYIIKQHGGMLAKGRLLGVQFDALMEDDLYFKIAAHADSMADKIRACLAELNIPCLVGGITNQIFPILPDSVLDELAKTICFTEMERVDDSHRCIRFCTSWATPEENVQTLISELHRLCK